jgi:Lrp/AsnC family transcriptional regulator for asnA, asnC and gidA
MQPDDIDWKIIDILRKGHIPNNAIAKELNVSEGMVRQRIKRLKEAKILTVRALINPDVLSSQQLAVIAVNVKEAALLENKAHEIAALENVLSVSVSSGRYDLMVEVLVSSNRGLVRFLTEELSSVQGVSNTESFMMLKTYNKFV